MGGRTIACAFLCLVCARAAAQPVLRYTFDEASGDALDTGAAPLTDATFQGGAVRSANTPSGTGSSLDLRADAPVAHLLGQNSSDLNGLTAITVTTWLNVETYTSGNHRLAAQQAGGAFGGFSWNMNAAPNDGPVGPDNFRLGLFVGNNISSGAADFGSAYSTADVDAANKWVFLAVTYDSSLAADNTLYYIGNALSSVAPLGDPRTAPQLTIDAGTARFGVGFTDAAPTANTSVIGFQDDVRVYDTALDLAALEAVRLENAGSGGGPLADFDSDDDVDQDDLADWKAGFGTIGTATKADGDADSDMDVDGADFLVWQRELGVVQANPLAIPEPTAGLLLILAFAASAIATRRQCR